MHLSKGTPVPLTSPPNPRVTSPSPTASSFIQNPLPMLRALPSPSNLLEWHYVLEGAPDSDYAGTTVPCVFMALAVLLSRCKE